MTVSGQTRPLLGPSLVPRPIDAFAPVTGPGGPGDAGHVYADDLIEVRGGLPASAPEHAVRTPHFVLAQRGRRLHIDHGLTRREIDDDLAGLLADELFAPGWVRGAEAFERIFTGIVRTTAADPVDAWQVFYANTLARVAEVLAGPSGTAPPGPGHGTIADYAPVYGRAEAELAPGSVLELGACFGFLSLRIAAAGRQVTATDVSSGSMQLLRAVAPRLGIGLRTLTADAARVPGPDRQADTVLAVHLLEHLDPDEGDRVIGETLRLARRRVVVAVPLEDEADETWGHVRTVSLRDLTAWGEASGRSYRVFEDHGGWLVVDQP